MKTDLDKARARLAAWERELVKGGQYADIAPKMIRELKRDIKKLEATERNRKPAPAGGKRA